MNLSSELSSLERDFSSLFFIHSTDFFQVPTSAVAVPGTRDPTNHLGLRGLAGDTESASTVSPGGTDRPCCQAAQAHIPALLLGL